MRTAHRPIPLADDPIRRPTQFHVLGLALLVAAIGVSSCSKGGSPTSPYGGGVSGGVAGPMLHLGPFALGQSATVTFATAGTFGYHCIPHQAMGMVGTVQVDAAGADSLVVQIAVSGSLSFTPSTAHIKPNGAVRWVNASNSTVHTVTSD